MKSASRMKQWLLLLLCVVMTAGVIVQAAGAAEPTKKCTNLVNEGVEYFSNITVMGSDVTHWRQNLRVFAVKTGDEKDTSGNYQIVGKIVGMDIEVTNDDTRYSCTINNEGVKDKTPTIMSCNSVPVNAIINGVYFLFEPSGLTPVDTNVTFMVERDDFSDMSAGVKPSTLGGLHGTVSKVALPPFPCARNLVQRDFSALKDSALVLYSKKDCADKDIKDQVLKFQEKYDYKNKYSIVNLMHNDYIVKDRIRVTVSPEEEFDYVLTLEFGYGYDESTGWYSKKADGSYCTTDQSTCDINRMTVTYTYKPDETPKIDAKLAGAISDFKNLTNDYLPLTLLGGNISKVNDKPSLEADWAGNVPFPTDVDFEIRFWYENDTGTLGYENSVFHFIRNINIQFSSTCSETAISPALYDFCQSTRQGFYSTFPTAVTVYDGTAQAGKNLYYSTYEKTDVTHKFDLGAASPTTSPVSYNTDYNGIIKSKTDPVWDGTAGSWEGRKAEFIFWFMTWKCVDAACDWTTSTSAYPYQLTMSDGGGASRTFTYRGGGSGKSSMTYYVMTPYFDTSRPYAIKGVNFVADEPGTYVIYTFMDYKERNKTAPDPTKYFNKIYVTVNATDELLTCSTLANNGYFQAWWNDCLSPSETQLIRFEHIKGTEEAWVRNRSNHDVSFPFVAEYSYLPQKLEVASLNCYFEQIDGQGNPGAGYCSHYNVFVPAHTKVTITGGTMYMSGYPEYDEYRAAYMREDTMNISHLIFHIGVEECKNKKIPDTGLSLRSPMSPLKVNEKVSASADPATGFVFTGNSLRIPAIGLGMETPIPIVHVYYENGTNNMVWDLSTLGNYVGELEGGSYIPYGGNSVLTGHFWSGGVFKNLEGLNYEDEIIIFANDGFKYTYSVVQKFIAQPEEVYEMFQQIGDRSLTLVTCENYNLVTNEYERRYIVRASIKNVEPYVENW